MLLEVVDTDHAICINDLLSPACMPGFFLVEDCVSAVKWAYLRAYPTALPQQIAALMQKRRGQRRIDAGVVSPYALLFWSWRCLKAMLGEWQAVH